MVFLTTEASALTASEAFLSNRGWGVQIVTDEKQALRMVVENKPSFFMVSVEHSNLKVRSLHKLLKQTCPEMCVVYFAEHNTMETYRLLTQSEHPYRIQPPITGPAVERAVNRYMKDLRQKDIQEELFNRSLQKSFPGHQSLSWASNSGDSMLSAGVVRVLEDVAVRGNGDVHSKLEKTTQTACVSIESDRFSGYLLVAMAGDHPFDRAFVTLIRERLVQFLRENGETVREEESFPMAVRQVNFEDWAQDYAEFLKKSVHEGQEIVMAFFPMTEVNSLVGATAQGDMCRVRIEDLFADRPVEFNLFVYMPVNQKHILYTPKGSVFFGHQKARLGQGDLLEMHVKQEELPAFRRYRAQHRIDALIREFESRIAATP